MASYSLQWPEQRSLLPQLRAGDIVRLSGVIYTARDAAHQRLLDGLRQGKPAPIPLPDCAIFYAGPAPCPPGKISGSIGPTTSGRMDPYKEAMLQAGMKLMIGKGICSEEIASLCKQYGAVYLAAFGGVAALTAGCIRSAEVVAWPDLGAEAIHRLVVEGLPTVVINDCAGRDYYRQIAAAGKKEQS